jgi:DNA polymerase III delta prime subunit
MIGQTKLLNTIKQMGNNFPKFSIIVGGKGSGKKLVCSEISKILNITTYKSGLKADEVRDTVEMSYKQSSPKIFLLQDADNMSVVAKNLLLKVLEEPPRNAYFIMTLTDTAYTLETIKSRGMIFNLDNYTPQELIEYRQLCKFDGSHDNILSRICSSTGEINELFVHGVTEFINYAKILTDNAGLYQDGVIFKITTRMKSKDNPNGFNPKIFFRIILLNFQEKFTQTKDKKYLKVMNLTAKLIQDLNILAVNDLASIDNWVMSVREVML